MDVTFFLGPDVDEAARGEERDRKDEQDDELQALDVVEKFTADDG
jgi:hypothetical protein